MLRPRRDDIVAGLHLWGLDGAYLGITLGPPHNDHVDVIDETGDEPNRDRVPWRDTMIGPAPLRHSDP